MNKAILVGRLTKDLELKKTASGQSVVNFTVAINRTFTNANGEREADFINCVAWGRTADNMSIYTKKGSLVGVDGRIQTRSYENQQGQKVFVTEVVAENVQFLESKSNNQEQQPQSTGNDFFKDFNLQNNNDTLGGLEITDDSLPF